MTKEREAAAAAVDRIWSNYKTDASGQIFRVDLLNAITGKRGAMDMISPSLVPINDSPAKTTNNSQPQARPPKYPNTYYNNLLPGITPSKSHFIDCLHPNPSKETAPITGTLLSNFNILSSFVLQEDYESRVMSLRPPTPTVNIRTIKVDGLQVDEGLHTINNQREPEIELRPFSCDSVYNEFPQNAQTEQARKTAHGEQLQTTPPDQNRQPTPPLVPEIVGLQFNGESVSVPKASQQSEQDNPLQAQLLEQSPKNHTETEQTAPPVQVEQTAETEQIAPPAQNRQPTPPTVSIIDQEELYIDIPPLEVFEQKAQANSLQTQPATQTAETEQTPYEEVYDDIPLASIPLASEQTAQDNRLITPSPESKVDVSIPNQTAQPAQQTAETEQTEGTGQIMLPAPDEQVAETLQPAQTVTQTGQNAGTKQGHAGITASLGFGREGDSGQQSGAPGTSFIPSGSIQRVNAQRKEGCFSSCTIS